MTGGFYKQQDGELLYAPNYVEGNGFVLIKDESVKYQYPVDGWYWFDSLEEAENFYNNQ